MTSTKTQGGQGGHHKNQRHNRSKLGSAAKTTEVDILPDHHPQNQLRGNPLGGEENLIEHQEKLRRVNRLACLGIAPAFPNSPTSGLEPNAQVLEPFRVG